MATYSLSALELRFPNAVIQHIGLATNFRFGSIAVIANQATLGARTPVPTPI
jgi:hypothetical protein